MTSMRFSDALLEAEKWLRTHSTAIPRKTVVLRDLFGRIKIALPPTGESASISDEILRELHERLGAYSPGLSNILIVGSQLLGPNAIFESTELSPIDQTDPTGALLLDRMLTGADWIRPKFVDEPPSSKRVTFYGLKGGVGRSTALAVLARQLAREGKHVLAIDLDLESPGISSLLLPSQLLPRFGVVDWFVEDAVGQADHELLSEIGAQSPLSSDQPGRITVVPAYGINETSYIPKLSRVTLDVRTMAGSIETFAVRLNRFVESLETQYNPDYVLLDSRAGLHDVAAIAIARLDALVLLFAANGGQTWQGYRLLFEHWKTHQKTLPAFRDNLRIVDALVPETGRQEHRANSLQSAHTLFAETIYEEVEPDVDENRFNFDLNDVDAPHFPIPIYWSRVFLGLDPANNPEAVTEEEIEVGFGELVKFINQATASQ